jgi:hypothetical protein
VRDQISHPYSTTGKIMVQKTTTWKCFSSYFDNIYHTKVANLNYRDREDLNIMSYFLHAKKDYLYVCNWNHRNARKNEDILPSNVPPSVQRYVMFTLQEFTSEPITGESCLFGYVFPNISYAIILSKHR